MREHENNQETKRVEIVICCRDKSQDYFIFDEGVDDDHGALFDIDSAMRLDFIIFF
jgi:hypothetical protein